METGNTEISIKLENVSKTFRVREKGFTIRDRALNLFQPKRQKVIHALKNIDLQIKKGEFFGIVGHNGSGKSTLLHIMSGAYPPDPGGKTEIHGRFIRLALGLGFDKELTAHENIYLNGSILGLTMKEIGKRYHDILAFAELQNFAETKVKFYSTGMLSRLKFAIAVQAEADIFLMDEFFGGVGDLRFKKISEEVFDRSIVEGRTIVHVSHNLTTIEKY
ncbi:MAG: ABC transporter ATP-binding protein, partial [Bacteroidia bacterium]|nr:ABC transporter ATP-binding protein [Bacteroidia bacterium]